MGLSQRLCTALGHPEEGEMALLLQRCKCADSILERDVGGHAGHLEEVHLLDPTELLVDERHAAPEVLRTGSLLAVRR